MVRSLGDATDGDLVARARKGDDRAYDALFQRHYARLANFAARLSGDVESAEDLAQTAFLRAYENLRRIRDGQAMQAWLYRTVVNLVKDRAKSSRRKPTRSFTDMEATAGHGERQPYEGPGDPGLDPARRAFAAERDRALQAAIVNLPLEFREPLVLHHVEEMDVARIAEVLGLPVGTVKSRLGRARARLREAMLPWFENE